MNGKKLCRLVNENLLYPIINIIAKDQFKTPFISSLLFDVDINDLKITHMFTSTSDEFSKQFGIPVSENVDIMSMIKITTTSKSNIKTLAKFLLFGLSEEMSYTVGNNTWYICETRLIDTTSVKLRDIPVCVNNLNERRIEMMISIGFRKELLPNKPKPISI